MPTDLFHEHTAPSKTGGCTFVFFNALTGDTTMWQGAITPRLHEAGHGSLVFNFKGQANSPFDAKAPQDAAALIADCKELVLSVAPSRPVLVGLSIGGLFALQAHLDGAPATGIVLLNTLRRDGPRLRWINDAVVRAVEVGGPELIRDLYTPLLLNEAWQGENRANCLGDGGYTPIDRASGTYALLNNVGRSAQWDIPYEQIKVPTLVITGLHDRVFRDPNDIDALCARLPKLTRVDFSDAGHMIPVEQPDALTTSLLSFAKDLG